MPVLTSPTLLTLLALGAGTAWLVVVALLVAHAYRQFLSDKDL